MRNIETREYTKQVIGLCTRTQLVTFYLFFVAEKAERERENNV